MLLRRRLERRPAGVVDRRVVAEQHIVATSLPLSNPSGTVRTSPCRPSIATRSMFGVSAASSGVLPPSSVKGSSAAPSGMMMAYFMLSL